MNAGRQRRLVGLVCLARLRQLGLAPWILLLAWLAWSALQEPELLRRSEIYLMEGAAWWGGTALLLALVGSEAALEAPPLPRLLANLLAAVSLSTLLALMLWGADLATASAPGNHGSLWFRMSVCFVVVAWAVGALQNLSQSYYWYVFAATQSVVFIGLSVSLAVDSRSLPALLASGSAACASALLTMRTPSYITLGRNK